MRYIPEVHTYSEHEPEVKQAAADFLAKGRSKQIRDAILEIYDDETTKMEEYAEEAISEIAAARATRFLESLIAGDEEAASRLFGFGEDGRRRQIGHDQGKPWPSVIHGKIYQTEPMKLREAIVNEFSETLKTERIADLEATVESLREQIARFQEREEQAFRHGGAMF